MYTFRRTTPFPEAQIFSRSDNVHVKRSSYECMHSNAVQLSKMTSFFLVQNVKYVAFENIAFQLYQYCPIILTDRYGNLIRNTENRKLRRIDWKNRRISFVLIIFLVFLLPFTNKENQATYLQLRQTISFIIIYGGSISIHISCFIASSFVFLTAFTVISTKPKK